MKKNTHLCIASFIVLTFINTAHSQCNGVVLTEIHYDNIGSDTGEFIEVAVPVDSVINLENYAVDLYNGSNGSAYNDISLDMFIQGSADSNYVYFTWFPASIQNGSPDGFALSYDSVLCEFLSYEGSFTGSDGPANNISSIDLGVSETGSTPSGFSLQRLGNTWTGPLDDTPGNTNMGPPCNISGISIDSAMCNTGHFVFNVCFNVANGSGIYEVVDLSNGNNVLATGSASPISVVLENNTDTTSFELTVQDQMDPGCFGNTISLTPSDCSCLVDVQLSGTENGDTTYHSSTFITSTQVIEVNANIIYNASSHILLEPGFELKQGALFECRLDGCN